jgi:hypothetical protein
MITLPVLNSAASAAHALGDNALIAVSTIPLTIISVASAALGYPGSRALHYPLEYNLQMLSMFLPERELRLHI